MTILPLSVSTPARLLASAAVLGGAVAAAPGDTVTLTPTKDNTLIEDSEPLSNGAGDSIYCGRTSFFGSGTLRRAVLAFDVAANVPAGSTITSASLTLTLLQAASPEETHTLHRLLADWGEGASNSPGGLGEPAQAPDATWVHTFFPDSFWTAPGGDFDPAASASQIVAMAIGEYTWSGPGMVADVQAWLDSPATSYGWVLIGNEGKLMTARRFGSKDNFNVTAHPKLAIEFTPPPCPGDTNSSGAVDVSDLVNVVLDWGCAGVAGECIGDVTGDGYVDVQDLVEVIVNWGPCA